MELAGVLHVAGAEPVNRYDLACVIAVAHGLPTVRLRRGSLAESDLSGPPTRSRLEPGP